MSLDGKKVVITGQFDFATKGNVETRIRVLGGKPSKAKKPDLVFAGRKPKEAILENAREKGIEIVDHDDVEALIGTPLYNYVERLQAHIRQSVQMFSLRLVYWHVGEPATEAQLQAAEDALGMPLPPTLRSLYEQANGMTFGLRALEPEETLDEAIEVRTGPFSHDLFMDSAPKPEFMAASGHDFWGGTMNIAPIESLFGSAWEYASADSRIDIGKYSFAAGDIFLFDATYCYQPMYLCVDRDASACRVAVGHDHSACLTDFETVSLESYLEDVIKDSPALKYRNIRDYFVSTWWKD